MSDQVGNPDDRFSHDEDHFHDTYFAAATEWACRNISMAFSWLACLPLLCSNYIGVKEILSYLREREMMYRKVPKFWEFRNLCSIPKIQTKRPNLGVFCQNDENGIANSEDPDQTAPPGAV